MGNSVLQTWRETGIQEKLESGVSAVKTKLTDPELQKEVKQKAQEGWSWLAGTASTWWNATVNTANSIASEFGEMAEKGGKGGEEASGEGKEGEKEAK